MHNPFDANNIHSTTILCVRKGKKAVIIGDGQVSFGHTVLKATANKIRKFSGGEIIGGFAGSTADAFTLFERLEEKLEKHPKQLLRSAVELAKDWRSDKYLRKLEAMMIVANKEMTLMITGNGDVIEPEHGVVAIGSGGNYALSAARALIDQDLDLQAIAKKSMEIAADICVYTNHNFKIETI